MFLMSLSIYGSAVGNWLDCEVVSPVQPGEREVVEERPGRVPRELLRARERLQLPLPGDFFGGWNDLLLGTEEVRGTWQEAGRVLAMNTQGHGLWCCVGGGRVAGASCQSG